MEQVECHTASAPSRLPNSPLIRGQGKQKSNQAAGKEDSSTLAIQVALTACCVQQGLDPGNTN